MDQSSTAQVDKMSPEEAKVFLRELLDGEAMRSLWGSTFFRMCFGRMDSSGFLVQKSDNLGTV